jgi:hypothetical protein
LVKTSKPGIKRGLGTSLGFGSGKKKKIRKHKKKKKVAP